MARPLPAATMFDARGKRRRNRAWPLGLTVFAMTVGNAALWCGIYAISHGYMAVDQRFFAAL
jgi:hypothetical protein